MVERERPALIKKKKQVEELYNLIKDKNMIALIRLKNLPDNLLQKTRKLLRGKAEVRVYKKTVIQRALKKLGRGETLIQFTEEPVAIIASNELTPYQLYWFFRANTTKRAARAGEVAPFDIIVPEGETDLPPGPALSELKAAKIQAQVRGGKIVVAKDSLVAKEGEVISDMAAKALQKLNILPFEVSVELLGAEYENVLFLPDVLNLSAEQLTQDLHQAFVDGYSLSINTGIPTSDNITYLVKDTYVQGYSLGVNAEIYSEETITTLLQKALAQSSGLGSITQNE